MTTDSVVNGEASASTRTSRRPLDQQRILRAGVEFIDDHGLMALTMRRLGSHLGVEAMALYRYVPGRDQLLDGVVEVLMDELYRETMLADPTRSWPEYLQHLAHGVRRLALAHPKVFPLVATRPPSAPWLRPPLRSLRWVEGFLAGLAHHGFSPESSVTVYRAFSTFLLGHLLLETASLDAALDLDSGADLLVKESSDLADYPLLTGLSDQLAEDAYADEFEDALEDMINRISKLRD